MTSRTIASRLALTLLAVAFALPALAQSAGNLRGTVTDETGNVVPNVEIVLTSQSTSFTQKVTSDDRGSFFFAAITPGLYKVEASLEGFKTFQTQDLRVGANDTLAIAVKLHVGNVVETISVVADSDLIQTSTGAREGLITPEQIESLSVMNRNPMELVRILPGVVAPDPTSPNYDTVGIGVGFGGVGNQFSINGARAENLGITMDGANLRDIGNNSGMMNVPNNEFVAEIKVQTSNYAAEYGSHITSVQAVTKSGSAEFHGSLYYYGRPYQLQANDRSRNYANPNRDNPALARPESKFHYPGLTLSGPILIPGTDFNKDRDKAFFFFGYELQKQDVDTGARLGVVPTAGMRNGDFSQFLAGAAGSDEHLGLGTNLSIPGGYANAGSSISNGDFTPYLTPTGSALMNLYPASNYSDADNRYNYITNRLNNLDRQQGVLRVDYNVSDNTRAYIRLARDKEAPARYRGLWWEPGGIETPTPLIQNALGMSAVMNVTSVLSPTTTNEVIFSWSRLKNDNLWQEPELMQKSHYGITNTVNPFDPTNPWVPELLNNWNGQQASMWFAQDVEDIFSYNGFLRLQDNLTKVLNTHALKFGLVVERQYKQQNFQHAANMTYILSTWGNGSSHNEVADILAGRPSQVVTGEPSAIGNFVAWNIEAFAQDSWKVNKNLTLEYGIRAGYWTPNAETNGLGAVWKEELYNPNVGAYLNQARTGAWDPTSGERPLLNGVAYSRLGDIGNDMVGSRPMLFMPRANFAWDLKGDGSTIVRGGAGIFYVREQGNTQYDVINVAPNSFQVTLDAYSYDVGALSYDNIGSQKPLEKVGAPGDINTPNPNDKAWPRAYNASISVAQRLPGKNVLEIGYVGTWQRHMVAQQQQNVVAPGGLYAYSNEPLLLAAMDTATVNRYRPYSTLGNVRYPTYVGVSNYNSLQVTLSRQSGSFTYLLTYTLSKLMGTTNTDFAGLDPVVIPNWEERDYGILATDRTHVVNASWSWRLGDPVKEGALGFLLNGWNLSGISTFTSGQPYRPFFNDFGDAEERAWFGTQDYQGGGGLGLPGGITPTYSCDPNLGTNAGQGEKIWDISCLGIPAFGQSGPNYPPNTLRLPGKSFHDLTVFKDFGLGGSRRLQLRFGVFNIFNQAYADVINFTDIDRNLDTESWPLGEGPDQIDPNTGAPYLPHQVTGVDNGNGGTANVNDPLGVHQFDSNTLSNFGKVITKRGHRTIELAVRLFF